MTTRSSDGVFWVEAALTGRERTVKMLVCARSGPEARDAARLSMDGCRPLRSWPANEVYSVVIADARRVAAAEEDGSHG